MVEFSDYHELDRRDPLAGDPHTDPDWPTIFGEPAADGMVSRERAAEALAALLRWICASALEPPSYPSATLSGIASRAIAALWSLDPGTFSGSPSQARLAAAFGKSHGWLTRPASEFAQTFGVKNRFQAHGRGGEHRQKLKVAFAPTVSFRVPISGAQEGPAPLVSSPEGVPTAPDDQNAPQGTEEALP